MLRLAHSPLNINKKSYRTYVCGHIETEIHLFFYCDFHDAARTGAEPDIFIWGGALEGPVLQQGELSMVCVGLSERDLQKDT